MFCAILNHFTAKLIFTLKYYTIVLSNSRCTFICKNCTTLNNPVLLKLAEFISPYSLFILPKTGSPKRKSSKMCFVLVTVHAQFQTFVCVFKFF